MDGVPLAFEENCLILTSDDELRIVSRATTTVLKSRNLGRLHQRMSEFLHGKHDRAEILSAVPAPSRDSVERYLGALWEAGAFQTGKPRRRQLIFAPVDQIRSQLLRIKPASLNRPAVYVSVETTPSDHDAAAQWLLNLGDHIFERGAVFYRFRPEPWTLARELYLDGPASLATIPRQMKLLKPAGVPQLPLVCMTAAHRLFPRTMRRFGLHHEQVENQLLREFLLHSLADEGMLPQKMPSSYVIADSLPNLRAAALEVLSATLPAQQTTPIDLLNNPAGDDRQLDYLLRILRMRLDKLPAGVTHFADGFIRYECGAHRRSSFIANKALRDLLLDVARDVFYEPADREMLTQSPTDFSSFLTSAELARSLRRAERQCASHLFYRKISCWGTTAYYGYYA